MLVLETICHETIWGGSKLTGFSKTNSLKIGHLYSVYCRETISNKILNGRWTDKTLNDAFTVWKSDFKMDNYTFFPLTIALTEAKENLSIQVHPDDIIANKIEHKSRGKRESWYFLEPPNSGTIINGCRCKSETEMKCFIKDMKYLEIADTLPISVDDYVFVAPGTLHSITAGSLVYEIEEGSDFTYRFYDYNRKDFYGNMRELHTEKACLALHINQRSSAQRYPDSGEIWEETYITKKIADTTFYENLNDTLECLTLIDGSLFCDGVQVTPGMTVILWPKEQITYANIKLAFSARLRGSV